MTPQETKKWFENQEVEFRDHLRHLLQTIPSSSVKEQAKEMIEETGNKFIRHLNNILQGTNSCQALKEEKESCEASIQHYQWRIQQIKIEMKRLKCK